MREVAIAYRPRAIQNELHDAIDAGLRHVLLVWHRRAGKTVSCVNQLIRSACTLEREAPRFAYVAPFYRQAKGIAWDYLRRFSLPIPGVEIRESELRVDYPNGGRVQLFGADNPDALRGLYLDGAVLDEYGQMHPSVRAEVLIPALTDRDGYEIVCGTPKGQNQFFHLFAGDETYSGAVRDPAWAVFVRPVSETLLLPKDKLEEARKAMGDEIYSQEFECSWLAASRGTYYAKLLADAEEAGRLTRVAYDPAFPVETSWDLGIGDATAIWFWQRVAVETRAIDYYEAEGEPLAHYAKMLAERGYHYGEHLVPHDAAARSLHTGKSLVELAKTLGLKMRVVPVSSLEEGIEATRRMIPRTWFDREKCKAGLDALRAYTRRYNARLDEYLDTPLHDWASHGSDAARVRAVDEAARSTRRRGVGQAPEFAIS